MCPDDYLVGALHDMCRRLYIIGPEVKPLQLFDAFIHNSTMYNVCSSQHSTQKESMYQLCYLCIVCILLPVL